MRESEKKEHIARQWKQIGQQYQVRGGHCHESYINHFKRVVYPCITPFTPTSPHPICFSFLLTVNACWCLLSSLRPLCESLYGVAATNWMEATCFTWCFMSVSLQHRIWAPHIVCYILCKTTLISIHCWTVAFAVGFGNVSRWWCIPYRFTCTPGFLLEKDGAGPHILEDFNVWDKWKKF